MITNSPSTLSERWKRLVVADRSYIEARMRLFDSLHADGLLLDEKSYSYPRQNELVMVFFKRLPDTFLDSFAEREFESKSRALYQEFVLRQEELSAALEAVLPTGSELLNLLKIALSDPSERATALRFTNFLRRYNDVLTNEDNFEQIFSELLYIASSYSGFTDLAREIILSLSREWLLANIEKYSEGILEDGTYEEYSGLIKLYSEIDSSLAFKLARRAADSADEDIREIGEMYLVEYQNR